MAYIDKDNLFKELDKAPVYFESGDIRYGIEIAQYILGTLPTADVVEVKHGKWIENKKVCNSPYCSVCGARGGGSYCHHCGAKMDLEE